MELELDRDRLHLAVEHVRNNGYVLFEDVIPRSLIDDVLRSFEPLLESHLRSGATQSTKLKHCNMYVPFVTPFADERVVAHPLALSVVEALLGEECICHYFASNTALPGSEFQPVHADIFPLFPDARLVLPPYSLVVNIPLVDFTEGNGPLEIWPGGSHHYVAATSDIPKLASTMKSERLLMRAGSVLIRDSRMWHRGTQNRSGQPRPSLALVYSREWLKLTRPRIAVPTATFEGLSARARRLFRMEAIGADPNDVHLIDPHLRHAAAELASRA